MEKDMKKGYCTERLNEHIIIILIESLKKQ